MYDPDRDTDLATIWPTLSQYVLQLDKDSRSDPVVPRSLPSPSCFESTLSQHGCGVEQALELFKSTIAPHLSTSRGPRYLGFITGGVTPAAFVGDVLATTFDQNVMTASETAGSAAADVEAVVMQLLKQLFDLPMDFDGVLTGGGTSSNTVALACARQHIGALHNIDIAQDGLQALNGKHICVLGTLAHQSISKAMSTLGMGRQIHLVAAHPDSPAMMDAADLDVQLTTLSNDPTVAGCIVITQGGEVNTSQCDRLPEIAEACKRHNAWLHLDAAANLLARASPTHSHHLAGIEVANSVTGDLHKWFNTPYDCGVVFTRLPDIHLKTFTAAAAYLGKSESFAPIDLSIDNSRRFRALPLWMALNAYGRSGFRDIVARTCQIAENLGHWVETSKEFELLHPVKLNTVLFRPSFGGRQLSDAEYDALAAHVLKVVNARGNVFMTGTRWQGRFAIRAAFANWRTTMKDLEIIEEALREGFAVVVGRDGHLL
ncbi:glutamate decarboxylase and related PLP-dependent protein [Fimicolochytrium jonesii]|uniref:glutamate decarboxylase and related PLP-dependent protein n=1 Tax=Fimicolochytrium jonesii TaxID=1396493 RepID=UPI0022FDFCF0|nr:glutamate decarboxylase and related PLP-dependent protein [Fimicolochytrium jonesii]KAI8822420.1 glutamate decarboxylase and related PLP-dependent protein [Fimicolochytrium jonesii]